VAGSFFSFLIAGVTLADFHSEGTVPVRREWLKSEQRLGAIIALHSFRIRPGIPSGPVGVGGIGV
jgi:hypothetical protein